MLNNKKAEIGETITWLVATVIIIVVLIIFVYASNVLGTFQTITVSSGEVSVTYNSNLQTKTNLAFDKNPANKEKINNWIGAIEKEDIYDLTYMAAG